MNNGYAKMFLHPEAIHYNHWAIYIYIYIYIYTWICFHKIMQTWQEQIICGRFILLEYVMAYACYPYSTMLARCQNNW